MAGSDEDDTHQSVFKKASSSVATEIYLASFLIEIR